MPPLPRVEQLKAEIAPGTPLEQLAAASTLAAQVRASGDALLDEFVDAARSAGCSWTEIGSTLGTSKQAAQQRFAALADPSSDEAPFGLSGAATQVLSEAVASARDLGHHYVQPEHLVLGLLAMPDELAGQVLNDLGITAERTRGRVGQRLGTSRSRPDGSLGVAPSTKRLLELSRAIANSVGHRCTRTEHILLAATSPKLHSPAAALLDECGVHVGQVRDQLAERLLAEAPELASRLRLRSLVEFRMRER